MLSINFISSFLKNSKSQCPNSICWCWQKWIVSWLLYMRRSLRSCVVFIRAALRLSVSKRLLRNGSYVEDIVTFLSFTLCSTLSERSALQSHRPSSSRSATTEHNISAGSIGQSFSFVMIVWLVTYYEFYNKNVIVDYSNSFTISHWCLVYVDCFSASLWHYWRTRDFLLFEGGEVYPSNSVFP